MPQPTKQPPPLRPLAIAVVIQGLKMRIPVAAVMLVALPFVPGLVGWLAQTPTTTPSTHRDVPPAWVAGIHGHALAALATTALNELPPAVPLQRTPPNCDPDLERPLRGACWVPVDVSPCPKGKAYLNDKGPEADGKCYARGMKAARSPTSGDPRPHAIADP